MPQTIGYAAKHSVSSLRPMTIGRREPAGTDVAIDILYCGVCHSDVHQAKNEWNNTIYPCMPGHEIVGRVSAMGPEATKFAVGDVVGVGCMVDSCGECSSCKEGLEQYCEAGFTGTYNGNLRAPSEANTTYGGYSASIVVRESFVLRIPTSLPLAKAAPLLCAGVTTYSPLREFKAGPGMTVGVVGLGGLGHVAVKLAVAMGADVRVVTTSADKTSAATALGATAVILSDDESSMKASASSLDLILSTIPQPHDPNPYIELLARGGTYVVVGCLVPLSKSLDMSKMNPDRRAVSSTLIGSIAETQEMLEFCAQYGITADVEVIDIADINAIYKRVDAGEVPHRFVIDMLTLNGTVADDSIAGRIGL